MSLDDSQEQDCTVYIQELKSDNPSLKLNAASKLPVIASVLGHNRIRDELVPYLIEIIEQMDNENQFLIKIAEGLYELKPYCKDYNECFILLPPLKILASLDQPSVREKAIESIQKLINGMSQDFHEEHIFPLIVEMSDRKNPYSPRVSAACLIPACYSNVKESYQVELQKIFKILGVKENSPLVRRAVAENIESYTRVVPKPVSKSDILEIWQKFIQDKIDIVKIKALECSSIVARFFKKDDINDKMLKYIKDVDPDKKAWRIRYALAEAIASLLPYLEKELIKKDSVQILQELLKDTDAQVRTIAILKIPELAQKLSPQQSFNIFFEYVEKSCKDTSLSVRSAVVEVLAPYLATLDKEKIKDSGLTLVMNLIKDENQNIRIGLIQRIKDFHEVVGEESTNQYLLPMIENCLNDKKWRFKLAIAESLKGLFTNLNYDKHKQFFNKVVRAFMKDHYCAVREQTMNSLINLKGIFGPERSMEVIGDLIKMLVNDANYVYRVTAIQFLSKAHAALEKNDFNQIFVVVCKAIENDKVPNIPITFLSNYPKIASNLTGPSQKEFHHLVRKFKEMDDEDVQYYANTVEQ